ncbi:DUF1801 domain-containing protein [Ensifer sp. ENS09]|uniref:DUF1801 domain-containing protein n=1 Tax=Ensifer sp. ENS09 TaxID=2769263 RepID=UPI001780F89B|nr:DUF1801 domain-containing protein [Ensifer sp. ENS09]MBD9651180.1 DUF1801 domain-containing protein [Ensifer sp. ENS09]
MTDDRIQALLREIELDRGDQVAIVTRLREIALSSGPAVTEEVKYGGILFSSAESFCGVFSYAHHVTLEFSRGAALPDPHAALEGSGKLRRHIRLLSPADIDEKHVAQYIEMARQAVDR